jgi:hypothetical protein
MNIPWIGLDCMRARHARSSPRFSVLVSESRRFDVSLGVLLRRVGERFAGDLVVVPGHL